MQNALFLRNLWYFALHGDKLKKGRLQTKELLGEKIVLGRDSNGNPFALRDNCPHRGVPLSDGKFRLTNGCVTSRPFGSQPISMMPSSG